MTFWVRKKGQVNKKSQERKDEMKVFGIGKKISGGKITHLMSWRMTWIISLAIGLDWRGRISQNESAISTMKILNARSFYRFSNFIDW